MFICGQESEQPAADRSRKVLLGNEAGGGKSPFSKRQSERNQVQNVRLCAVLMKCLEKGDLWSQQIERCLLIAEAERGD